MNPSGSDIVFPLAPLQTNLEQQPIVTLGAVCSHLQTPCTRNKNCYIRFFFDSFHEENLIFFLDDKVCGVFTLADTDTDIDTDKKWVQL